MAQYRMQDNGSNNFLDVIANPTGQRTLNLGDTNGTVALYQNTPWMGVNPPATANRFDKQQWFAPDGVWEWDAGTNQWRSLPYFIQFNERFRGSDTSWIFAAGIPTHQSARVWVDELWYSGTPIATAHSATVFFTTTLRYNNSTSTGIVSFASSSHTTANLCFRGRSQIYQYVDNLTSVFLTAAKTGAPSDLSFHASLSVKWVKAG